MSVENIIKRLEEEKEEKISEIKDKVQKELEKYKEKRIKETEEWKQGTKKKLEEDIAREESIEIAKKNLEFKEKIASLENMAIEKLKNEIFNRFLALEKEEYQRFWERMLEKMEIKGGELVLARNENKLDVSSLCKKFNLTFNNRRYDAKLGFIIEKENVVFDLTLEELIENIINENLLDIAKILRG